MKNRWIQPWIDLFHLFFPRCCPGCGELLLDRESHLCLLCQERLARLPHFGQEENGVSLAMMGPIPFVWATAYLQFQQSSVAQRIIHQFKYHHDPYLAYWMGQQAARELAEAHHPICQVERLVPVPLHSQRLRERGYNQSEWIARGIHSVWGTPLETHVLFRCKKTETQTRKTTEERIQNMAHAFCTKQPERLRGQHVLLIDDVITTGATLKACAEALLPIEEIRISYLGMAFA